MRLPGPAFLRDNARWLGAGALLTFSSGYGQTFFISIFADDIRGEFGLSHGGWGAIYGIGTLGAAGLMIWAGALVDRFRVRRIGAWVLGLLALACLAMALVPAAWALVPVILLLRFAGQGMPGHIAMTGMARWFVATRGRALSVASLGFAGAEAVLPLGFVALSAFASWRQLWVLAALLALAAIPLLLRLLTEERTPRGSDDEAGQVPGLEGRHWTRAAALRHPLFWLMVPAMLGPPTFSTALFFQQVHIAESKGWTHLEFVALFPLYTAVGVTAMLASGWAIDRFGTARLMPLSQLPLICGMLLMGRAEGLAAGAAAMAALALTTGVNNTLPAAFWAEFYGTRHLGAIRAMTAAVMVLGTAIGPALTGRLIDAGFGFDAQTWGIAAYLAVASLLMAVGIARARGGLPPRGAALA